MQDMGPRHKVQQYRLRTKHATTHAACAPCLQHGVSTSTPPVWHTGHESSHVGDMESCDDLTNNLHTMYNSQNAWAE